MKTKDVTVTLTRKQANLLRKLIAPIAPFNLAKFYRDQIIGTEKQQIKMMYQLTETDLLYQIYRQLP